jgi:hypothetical protein
MTKHQRKVLLSALISAKEVLRATPALPRSEYTYDFCNGRYYLSEETYKKQEPYQNAYRRYRELWAKWKEVSKTKKQRSKK